MGATTHRAQGKPERPNATLGIVVDLATFERVRALAGDAQMSVSAYLRLRLQDALKETGARERRKTNVKRASA